jgi:hypothetical protein
MTTASEEILARRAQYDRIEREADALGRIIGVKRLKPSQQIKVEEMAPGLSGTSDFKNEAGEMVAVSRRAPLMLAASVREIDSVPVRLTRSSIDLIPKVWRPPAQRCLAWLSPAPMAKELWTPQKTNQGFRASPNALSGEMRDPFRCSVRTTSF